MLDYVFYKLGIPTETVQHPIVMTESLCNPHYSRSREFSFAIVLHQPADGLQITQS